MKVRKEYQGLSRQDLLDELEKKGRGYFVNSTGCAPCTVAALYDVLGFDAMLVKAATGLSGGTAEQFLGACGVLSGGVTVLGYYFGRPIEKMSDTECIQANIEAIKRPFEIAGLLADRFIKEYGTFICAGIHRQLFGRIFCLTDPDEVEKFNKADGLAKGSEVVGRGARWVMEILLDKGVVEL
jgi:hypothetical protein